MNNYSEYKLADKVRAETKRANCIHCQSAHLYYICGECGTRKKIDILGEKIKEPIYLLDIVCDACSEKTIA